MERNPTQKSLRLSRTTIRKLTEQEAEQVVGAYSARLWFTCGCTVANSCGSGCTVPGETLPYSMCCGGTSL